MREHGPQRVDMRLDAPTGLRPELALGRHFFRRETGFHECAQVETRLGAAGLVFLEDRCGVPERSRVDEALAVLEGTLHLHPLEQARIQLRRRRRCGGARCARRAGHQPGKQADGAARPARSPAAQNS
jgi:hypothetical protein